MGRLNRISGGFERFRPHPDGSATTIGKAKGEGLKIRHFQPNGLTWNSHTRLQLEVGSKVQLSDSGRSVVLFPEGETSQEIEVFRLPGVGP